MSACTVVKFGDGDKELGEGILWDKKYRLSAKDGTPVDKTMDDTYKRVARALADVEHESVREQWYEKFVWALRFTAVVVREADGWKFAQMNFSFPTIYFPDVRLME